MLYWKSDMRKGFSLVELLIVIAVLGIIATIAIPILVNARNQAINKKAQSSLRTVISAEMAFYNDFGYYGDFSQLDGSAGAPYTQIYLDDRFSANNLGNGINITTAPVGGNQTFSCVIVGATNTYSADESALITET
jgi:type IV pilus assembly protein PilA